MTIINDGTPDDALRAFIMAITSPPAAEHNTDTA